MENGDRELFEQTCLKAHNDYRAKHGAPPLKLSRQICQVSQQWANRCAQMGVMQHSTGTGYGENIYCAWSSDPNYTINGKAAVDAWYAEIKDYSYGTGFSYSTGHFTQVVWKDSTELGIGCAKSYNGQIYVVANYSPPGNYQGKFTQNVLPLGTPVNNETSTQKETQSTSSLSSNQGASNNATGQNVSEFSQYEFDCLKAQNDYRPKHGVPPLKLSRKIYQFHQNRTSNIEARD